MYSFFAILHLFDRLQFNFQQVAVADSPPSPAGLLRSWGSWGLDNVKDKISDDIFDSVEDVIKTGNRVIQGIGGATDKITDSIGSRLSTRIQQVNTK